MYLRVFIIYPCVFTVYRDVFIVYPGVFIVYCSVCIMYPGVFIVYGDLFIMYPGVFIVFIMYPDVFRCTLVCSSCTPVCSDVPRCVQCVPRCVHNVLRCVHHVFRCVHCVSRCVHYVNGSGYFCVVTVICSIVSDLGSSSIHSYLDGVPFRIGPAFCPPQLVRLFGRVYASNILQGVGEKLRSYIAITAQFYNSPAAGMWTGALFLPLMSWCLPDLTLS